MGELKDRFNGVEGKPRVRAALEGNPLVLGSAEITEEFMDCGRLIELGKGETLIAQGSADNTVFAILAGAFAILVRGTEVAVRRSGSIIGEQAMIDPTLPRTASAVALDDSVVLELTDVAFEQMAARHSVLWRRLAKLLSQKLNERNRNVPEAREMISIFMICSKEALWVAQEIQAKLSFENVVCTLWTDGVFRAGEYPIEALERALADSDLAIAVAGPDDFVQARGEARVAPRDNVVFELGFFMGRLGRKRAILMEPRDEDLKLPSDLSGITTIPYQTTSKDKLSAMLAGPTHEVRKLIDRIRSGEI